MCDPVTATMAGLAIASTLMAHEAGVDAAESQTEALAKQEDLRQMDIERQASEQREIANQEMNAANRQAIADMATFDTIAGEYGGGNSTTRERNVIGVQRDETLATIASNARNGMAEIGFAAKASRNNALSQISAVKGPSQVGTLLAIGGQAVGAYNSYQTNQRLDKLAAQKATPIK